MRLFPIHRRRKRSEDNRHYTKPECHDVSFKDLLVQQPLELYHFPTQLYSVFLRKLHILYAWIFDFTRMQINLYHLGYGTYLPKTIKTSKPEAHRSL